MRASLPFLSQVFISLIGTVVCSDRLILKEPFQLTPKPLEIRLETYQDICKVLHRYLRSLHYFFFANRTVLEVTGEWKRSKEQCL